MNQKVCDLCGSTERVKRVRKTLQLVCYSCYTGISPEQAKLDEIDRFWAQAVHSKTAPEHIMIKDFRLQRLTASIIEVKDELRDWAKKEMEKE